ncbi:MAG: helix-turn-helix domain-containing protein [Sedimenticolaceae bacterium]
MARQRELKLTSIYSHFAEAVEAGMVDVREILPLNPVQYSEIIATLEMERSCEEGKLKPLYEALDGRYDYGILKCIMAAECI